MGTTRYAVPRPDEIIGPAIQAMAALRPQVLAKLNGLPTDSYYARVVKAGWRAQAARLLAQIGDEVASSRLGIAEGQSLLDLVADEYQTVVDPTPTPAYGSITLSRTGLAGGVIRQGTNFRRLADATLTPIVNGSAYQALADTVVLPNVVSNITVPIVATTPGTASNAPIVGGSTLGVMQIGDQLFDSTFVVASFESAGGSDGVDEDAVRAEASAFSVGQYAPTIDAIRAGALRGTGVRYAGIQDFTSYLAIVGGQPVTIAAAFTNVAIADESWASSGTWNARVQQTVADNFQGFGCAVKFAEVSNEIVSLAATVILRDAKYLADTTDLDAAIQAELVDYFDHRPDFWTFRYAQIRAVIARADRRILTCTSAQLKDSTGSPLAEPSAPVATSTGATLTHFMLPQGSAISQYNPPS